MLATAAVLLCQAAGLAMLHSRLTAQVDARLTRFQVVPQFYQYAIDAASTRGETARSPLPSDYRVYFYDSSGNRLAASLGGDEDSSGPLLPQSETSLNLADGRPATGASSDGSSHWRVIARAGPEGARVVVALPLKAVDDATSTMLWFSLIVGLAVAAGFVVFGNVAVRVGLRPLVRVERTARRIADGELELSVSDGPTVTEVGHLGRALDTMLERLRTALRRSEASEQRLRRFLADAGHELRTPLTSLQGFAQLLVGEPEMSPARRHEAHQLMVQNAERMSRLVDDLFQLAKLSDEPVVRREHMDLLSLAADSITAVALRHPDQHIGLGALATQDGGPATSELDAVETYGDPHQLGQIITNLLVNACVHTPSGSRIQVRVGTLRVRPGGAGTDRPGRTSAGLPLRPGTEVCVIEVADNGAGLAAPDAQRVFERFYRAESTRSSGSEPGTGLGLAIASAIAATHEGRLELDTRLQQGCTFRLLLPCKAVAVAAGQEEPPLPLAAPAPLSDTFHFLGGLR
ncbi:HAMP domain-containing sensor histidine kinase [Streptomyces sp. NPDC002088]|uniref:sensor histidine kinase n=1 Tax=Streptomyces sp. NPDC002088 TaxID=3154665 RepID=UPI00332A3FC1